MTKCISNVALKLPVVVDGVFDSIIFKFLADILPSHVYPKLKAKRDGGIRRVAVAIVGAHASHDTTLSESAPPPDSAAERSN